MYLKPVDSRPDFRLVKVWLWGENHETDSYGNSFNPADRDWTELYLSSRKKDNEYIDIYPICENPPVLQIKGSAIEIILQTAYFLCVETNGQLSYSPDFHKTVNLDQIKKRIGAFNISEARERTDKSIWRKSSLNNPYPNLPTTKK